MVAVLMRPRYGSKFFTQACQHTLYGVSCMRITLLFLFLCMHESLHAFKFNTCLMQRMFFSGTFLSFPYEESINLCNFLSCRLDLNFGRLALLLNICFSFLPFIPAPFQESSFSGQMIQLRLKLCALLFLFPHTEINSSHFLFEHSLLIFFFFSLLHCTYLCLFVHMQLSISGFLFFLQAFVLLDEGSQLVAPSL